MNSSLTQERIGEYETDVYSITNLILVSRRRREHLTPEQIQEHEKLQHKVETGNIEETDLISEVSATAPKNLLFMLFMLLLLFVVVVYRKVQRMWSRWCSRLLPLTPTQYPGRNTSLRHQESKTLGSSRPKEWPQQRGSITLFPPRAPRLGRQMDLKVDRKHFKASICVVRMVLVNQV